MKQSQKAPDMLESVLPKPPQKPRTAGGNRAQRKPARIFDRYASVAVNEPVWGLFDYGVPAEMEPPPRVGSVVEVPFGGRPARGCVVRIATSPPAELEASRIKPISRVVSPDFLLERRLIDLALWISDYYMAPPGEAMSCVSFIGFNDAQPKRIARVKLAAGWPGAGADEKRLTVKQTRVVEAFLAAANKPLPPPTIQTTTGAGIAVIRKLLERGILVRDDATVSRADEYEAETGRDAPLSMNPAQQVALRRIADSIQGRKPETFLIHGVTGSGKTEVYLQAIQTALDAGGCAIVLVPEISLTPQTVGRFRRRFGDIVGVYHSRMTIGQKFDLWRRVRDGHCRIMVGARSALFTPFDDLRIIVVDEEHEASYKQDSSPRYHARDVAIVRAQRDNCTVALGSATPSVETYFKAQSGKFHLLSLPERIDFRPLPAVRVVDMTREAKENQNVDLFSGPLQSAISDALGNGDQVLVFLNRRGFFNFVVCLDCKAAARCEHCDVAMTYHKTGEALICHYCNSRRKRPSACEACGSREVTMIGVGTQRVEEKLQAQYPEYPLIRMDLDTTRHRTAYIEAWRRIERQEVKIILGTQMVAKGLHLENVTVVGVPLADVSLFQPDFRSAERAFSLLTQVAGRAGRGAKPGQVIIQTYVPHHYAIAFAQTHDYRGFYDKEIRVRQVLRFPPHFRLISVLGLGKDSKATAELFREFARRLSNAAFRTNGAVTVLGPAPAPLARIEDHYRWRLLLRGREHRIMKDVLKEALRHYSELPGKSKVLLIVDIDPQDLL